MSMIFNFKRVQISEHNDSFTTSSISFNLKIDNNKYKNQRCQVKQNEGADMESLDALEVKFEGSYPEGFQYNSAQNLVKEYYIDFLNKKIQGTEDFPEINTTIKFKKTIKEL